MKIDVVICTYNRAGLLGKCVESVLRADVPPGVSVEVIVVDNNSSDDTEKVVKGFGPGRANGMKVTYLFEGKQGKSYALNSALAAATGDIVAFIDDDETVEGSWVREIVEAERKYPACGSFGGKIVAAYPEDMPEWLDIKGSMKFLKSVYGDLDNGDEEKRYGDGTLSNAPGGGNMFFRKEALKRNGPFRTDLGPTGRKLGFSEDTEFCVRFQKRGEVSMYIPGAVVYHSVPRERLEKGYILKWLYNCGKSEVRRTGGHRGSARAFGVPRYLYRKLLQHASGSLLSFHQRTRAYHRLKLYYTAGELVEHFRAAARRQHQVSGDLL